MSIHTPRVNHNEERFYRPIHKNELDSIPNNVYSVKFYLSFIEKITNDINPTDFSINELISVYYPLINLVKLYNLFCGALLQLTNKNIKGKKIVKDYKTVIIYIQANLKTIMERIFKLEEKMKKLKLDHLLILNQHEEVLSLLN
jgi:hypothetical protein